MPRHDPIFEAAEGIYQVRIPLPFALNIVNCYLLRDRGGWTIVDTGLNRPESQTVWAAAFDALRIKPASIRRIVLTHMHPDHYGLAGWLQRQSPHCPPVVMSPIEWNAAQRTWINRDGLDDRLWQHLTRCGLPSDLIAAAVEVGRNMTMMTAPHPERVETLEPGSSIEIGSRVFRTIHAPGHSDGQLLLYCADDGLMISGDHVLMKITPNIGVWQDTPPQPLRQFLDSLRFLRQLDVSLALPGHKTVITNWAGRIDELLAHHDQRLAAVAGAVGDGATVYQVSQQIFEYTRLTNHEIRFAIAETLAHLLHLQAEGRLTCDDGDTWRFEPVR